MRRIRAFLAVFWAILTLGLVVVTVCAVWSEEWGRWSALLPPLALMVTVLGVALIVERIVASIVTGREESGIKAELKGRT
jgi:branched-subunit amino acid ABC-type transport system permease component